MTIALLKKKRSRLPRLRLERHSEEKQIGKALRLAGGYCFDQLTLSTEWADDEQRSALRNQFARKFKAVIRKHERQRFEDGKYGPIIIGGHGSRSGRPYYLDVTIERMSVEAGLPEVAWPPTSAVWIDVRLDGIVISARDKSSPFWQTLYPRWVLPR